MKPNLLAEIQREHVRFTQLPNEKGHDSVWDFVRAPDGRFYISICGETVMPLSALLYEYYPETGDVRLIVDVEKAWIVNSEQMPPSKIHTSIDFLPDGKLIMATHNTSPAPSHKKWLYEQHYEHTWEGYQGSIVMIVDPDTNEVTVKGIPVPRESIYGGILGDDPKYYYFLGYMRGHFYRLNLETNEVRDYGKISEFASCRLIKDNKGRIYGSSYTGEIWRYDPEEDEVKDLKVCFISPHGTKQRRALIFALHSPRGTLFLCNNTDGEMIELHPETLEVTRHGFIHLRPEHPRNPMLAASIGGLAADENFVLYYGLESYHDTETMRLVKWDILNGGEPENLGLISPDGKVSRYICEMVFDDDGILHMVDVCGEYSPYLLAVDVKKLKSPRDDARAAVIETYIPPEFHMNNDSSYFMHIKAEKTRTLPLHRTMEWKNTSLKYVSAAKERLYGLSGKEHTYLIESDYMNEVPTHKDILYNEGYPVSCLDWESHVAVLTSDKKILKVNLQERSIIQVIPIPDGINPAKILCAMDTDKLLISDVDGQVYRVQAQDDDITAIDSLMLSSPESYVIRLDASQILLSGKYDQIIQYDLAEGSLNILDIKSSFIKGRAFSAAITGGIVLDNGSIVAGTSDGMLFRITQDLKSVTSYGRLYSTGMLREFVNIGHNSMMGVYGGIQDAGHVFFFSEERGLLDLGRPRVIKDNAEQLDLDTEWANIHYISTIAYDPESDYLCVASGEQYGCIVRYKGVV